MVPYMNAMVELAKNKVPFITLWMSQNEWRVINNTPAFTPVISSFLRLQQNTRHRLRPGVSAIIICCSGGASSDMLLQYS